MIKKRITGALMSVIFAAVFIVTGNLGVEVVQAASPENGDEITQEQTLSEEEKIALLTSVLGMPVEDGTLDLDPETEAFFRSAELFGYYGSVNVNYEQLTANAVYWITTGENGASTKYDDIIDNLKAIYGECKYVGDYDDILSDAYVWTDNVYDCEMVACGIDTQYGNNQIAIYWFDDTSDNFLLKNFDALIDNLMSLPESALISKSDLYGFGDDYLGYFISYYDDSGNDSSLFTIVYGVDSNNQVSIILNPQSLNNETGSNDFVNMAMYLNKAVDESMADSVALFLATYVIQNGGSEVSNGIEYSYSPDADTYKIIFQYGSEENNDEQEYMDIAETVVILNELIYGMDESAKEVSAALEYINENAITSYDDILSIQDMWSGIADEIRQLEAEFASHLPPEGYQELWRSIQDSLLNAADSLSPCMDLDANGDGNYTSDECNSQLDKGRTDYASYMYAALDDIETLQSIINTEDSTTISSISSEDSNKTGGSEEIIQMIISVLGLPVAEDGTIAIDDETYAIYSDANLFGYSGTIEPGYDVNTINNVKWTSIDGYDKSEELEDIIGGLESIYGQYDSKDSKYKNILTDAYIWETNTDDFDIVAMGFDGNNAISICWGKNTNGIEDILMDAIYGLDDLAGQVVDLSDYADEHSFETKGEVVDYQNAWVDIINQMYELGEEFDSQLPPEKYQELWDSIKDSIVSAADALAPCTDLDINGDGTVTGSEVLRQLNEGTSNYTSYMDTAVDEMTELLDCLRNDESTTSSDSSGDEIGEIDVNFGTAEESSGSENSVIDGIMECFIDDWSTPITVSSSELNGITTYAITTSDNNSFYIVYTQDENGVNFIEVAPYELDDTTGESDWMVVAGRMIYAVDDEVTSAFEGMGIFSKVIEEGSVTQNGINYYFVEGTDYFAIEF